MDQINAEVDCDVSRLDFPLRAWKARQGHNFVALFRRVPADVTGLFVRVFKGDGAYSWLRMEAGTHRVQRVPDTETSGRVQVGRSDVSARVTARIAFDRETGFPSVSDAVREALGLELP